MDEQKGNIKAGEKSRTTNFEKEYTDSFNKGLLYSKLAATGLEYIRNTNPAVMVLSQLDGLDESIKKDCTDRISGQMQKWLMSYENMLDEGKTLPVDLIGLASDLARKDREGR